MSELSNFIRGIRTIGKIKKEVDRMSNEIQKPFYKSSTTQTVAGSAIGSLTIGWAIVKGLRMIAPQYVIWSEAEDATIANILTVILTPIISRIVALIRKG